MAANDFFQMVYEVARHVPKGRVTSYGAIGKYLGSGKSARMVGWAMGALSTTPPKSSPKGRTWHTSFSPLGGDKRGGVIVPAHRVVNRNGELTGKHHFGHPKLMQQLLEKEGIKVKHDKVVNLEKVFWDPAKELKL